MNAEEISMQTHQITVVGGCNIDISATSYLPLVAADSNPGQVKLTLGGVGRNVAENLARLSQSVTFLSALGGDQFADLLQRHARTVGYDMSQCAYDPDMQNSVYICINEPSGEMSVAVNDMSVCELITPDFMARQLPHLNRSEAVVLDMNLPESTVEYIAEHCDAPLFADTVSTKKALRLKRVLPHIHTLKTNRIEAQLLTGMEIADMTDVPKCVEALHAAGVQQVMLTLGADGAYASDGKQSITLPSFAHNIKNTTGCGDAFFAGIVASTLEKLSLAEALRHGLAMAAICATEAGAVSQTITVNKLQAFLREYEGGDHQ